MLEAQRSQSMAQPTPLFWSAWGYDGKPSFNMTTLCIKHARDLG